MPWPTGLVVKNGSNIRAWTSGLIPAPVSDTASTRMRPLGTVTSSCRWA